MLWTAVGLLALVPVSYRMWEARSLGTQRPSVSWWSFSLTFVGIVAGSAFLTNEEAVNTTLGVANLSYLLSNLWFSFAAASVNVFVHTLRRAKPSTRHMVGHGIVGVVLMAVMLVSWLTAPLHGRNYPTFRQVPVTAQAIGYDVTFHVYLALTLANVAVCGYQIARAPAARRDPGRLIGGILISIGGAVDVVAHILYLIRLALQPAIGAPALRVAAAADALTPVCLLFVGIGSVIFLLVPRLEHRRQSRYLQRELQPLWQRLRQLYPGIALPGPVSRSPGQQAERMLLEIADGWRQLPVPTAATGIATSTSAESFKRVVDALIDQHSSGMELTAARVLPRAQSRQDEERIAVQIAHEYRTRIGEIPRASRAA